MGGGWREFAVRGREERTGRDSGHGRGCPSYELGLRG